MPSNTHKVPTGGIDDGFQKLFIDPSLKELSKGLEDVMKQMDEYTDGQTLEDIVQQLEKIIVHGDPDSPEFIRPPALAALDKTAHLAMLGQSIIAYLTTLDSSHVRRLTTRIISDTTLWLSRLFRFDDSSAYYHTDDREGLLRVCRLALNSKYEKYGTEGFNTLYSKPPIIYISAASRPGLGHYICSQLGLPLSSLCTVPCNTVFGSQHTMDIASLERLIKDDVASTKTPLIVMANVGTPMAGHTDNLSRLRTICDENNVWLHVEGHNLSTLALATVPSSVLAAKRVNSMTIQPGVWLGLPGSPSVTLYKTADPSLSLAAGLMSSQPQDRLCALPLWLGIQSLGYNGILERLTHAAELSQHLSQRLQSLGSINLTDKKERKKKQEDITLGGSLSEIISQTIIQVFAQTDTVSPVVVFKFDDKQEGPGSTFAPYSDQTDKPNSADHANCLSSSLLNAFNSWLGSELTRQIPKVPLEVVEGEQEGVCLRFSPMQSVPYYGTTSEDIDGLITTLKDILDDLSFTITSRQTFRDLVEDKENLVYIENEEHAGLGVVQFLPDYLKNEESEQGKKELDSMNADIVQRLQAGEDQAVYVEVLAPTETRAVGLSVVKRGTNYEEIIERCWTTGKELEDSSKFLETMSEIILKGIMEAEKELEKENDNKLIEEGVLRQIPLMSSFMNWWSPPPKDAIIKGRSLNLSSGSLESTEKTYNLKMQLFEDKTPTNSPTKTTPPDTPITADTNATPQANGTAVTNDSSITNDTLSGNDSSVANDMSQADETPKTSDPSQTPQVETTPKSILKKRDLEADTISTPAEAEKVEENTPEAMHDGKVEQASNGEAADVTTETTPGEDTPNDLQ